LTRAFSWLQSKYAMTATKRLRVSETVSLGEKRFVALVTVEGREFLIGGGSAGVSLLAQLSNETKGADGLGSALAGGEDAG
jgi:flagellar biogenesis protein FliO